MASTQPALFDGPKSKDWAAAFEGVVHNIALECGCFTVDNIWAALEAAGYECWRRPARIAPLLRSVARSGVADPTDLWVASTRKPGTPVRLWRSNIMEGPKQ